MNTIQIYKTNIDDRAKAKLILDAIREALPASIPSIDLDDCDKVLRVENILSGVDESVIKKILKDYEYNMEVLP